MQKRKNKKETFNCYVFNDVDVKKTLLIIFMRHSLVLQPWKA